MAQRFRISPVAQSDVDQIWDFIADDDLAAATRFVDRLTERFQMLARQPLIGESREELQPRLRVNMHALYRNCNMPSTRMELAAEKCPVAEVATDALGAEQFSKGVAFEIPQRPQWPIQPF